MPVKVSTKLYEQIKARAEAEGLTLQDALTEILTEPSVEVEELRDRVDAANASQRTLVENVRGEVARLSKRVESTEATVARIEKRLSEVIKRLNSWVPDWTKIPNLEATTSDLEDRVSALEEDSHRHFYQS